MEKRCKCAYFYKPALLLLLSDIPDGAVASGPWAGGQSGDGCLGGPALRPTCWHCALPSGLCLQRVLLAFSPPAPTAEPGALRSDCLKPIWCADIKRSLKCGVNTTLRLKWLIDVSSVTGGNAVRKALCWERPGPSGLPGAMRTSPGPGPPRSAPGLGLFTFYSPVSSPSPLLVLSIHKPAPVYPIANSQSPLSTPVFTLPFPCRLKKAQSPANPHAWDCRPPASQNQVHFLWTCSWPSSNFRPEGSGMIHFQWKEKTYHSEYLGTVTQFEGETKFYRQLHYL